MSTPLPKPDKQLLDSIYRLKNTPEFQLLVSYQRALLEHHKNALVTAAPEDVPRMQGRAANLQDFLDLLSKDPR